MTPGGAPSLFAVFIKQIAFTGIGNIGHFKALWQCNFEFLVCTVYCNSFLLEKKISSHTKIHTTYPDFSHLSKYDKGMYIRNSGVIWATRSKKLSQSFYSFVVKLQIEASS